VVPYFHTANRISNQVCGLFVSYKSGTAYNAPAGMGPAASTQGLHAAQQGKYGNKASMGGGCSIVVRRIVGLVATSESSCRGAGIAGGFLRPRMLDWTPAVVLKIGPAVAGLQDIERSSLRWE